MQLCTSLAIRYLYCITGSSRCYVFVQEAIKEFEFEFGISCVRHKISIVVLELISSTWVKPNPRYDSKCEYIFYNL